MAAFAPTESHVGTAGDWHGNTAWALQMLDVFASHRIKTILHVGDFGLWPGESGRKYINSLDRRLYELGMSIYVTPGNHEDYDQLKALPISEDGLSRVTPRIVFMPRGYRWRWGAHDFLSLGGAASVDFDKRREGATWWRDEVLTMGDIMRLEEQTERFGTVDVMIGHDAPEGVRRIDDILDGNPTRFSDRGIEYAQQSRKLMTAGWKIAKPSLMFHGHYHINVDEMVTDGNFQTRVVGLHRDGFSGNIASLALDDLRVNRLV